VIKWAVIGICLALAALSIMLAASGFFIAAFYLWVASRLGAAEGAVVTGGALLLVAAGLAVAGAGVPRLLKRRSRSLLNELQNTIWQAAKTMLLRSPKKALLASLLAGALSESIFGPHRKR
jgi:high-affinity Fe2+/Pb2+ permease